jgi:hypothetical protein
MTFEEWCDVNYPRVERLERTLMSIAWDAALASVQPPEATAGSDAKDAARYRWLRAKHNEGTPDVFVHFKYNAIPWHHPSSANLDTWLDAAMASSSRPQRVRPPKPQECEAGCPPKQVCDHCQWPSGSNAAMLQQGETNGPT